MQNCQEIANSLLVQIDKKTIYTDERFEKQQNEHRERKRTHLYELHQDITNIMRAVCSNYIM